MGDDLEDKIKRAKTEAIFRDVNERIAESSGRFDSQGAEFVCECADPECTDRIETSLDQYEAVRQDATTFLLVNGHEDPKIEKVVQRHRGFAVVRKVEDVVARTVRRLDPRAQPV
jgi:hypothetical protein